MYYQRRRRFLIHATSRGNLESSDPIISGLLKDARRDAGYNGSIDEKAHLHRKYILQSFRLTTHGVTHHIVAHHICQTIWTGNNATLPRINKSPGYQQYDVPKFCLLKTPSCCTMSVQNNLDIRSLRENEGSQTLYSKESRLVSIRNNFLSRSERISRRAWALVTQVISGRHCNISRGLRRLFLRSSCSKL